jgi:Fe2+ transport system protein FeoA
MLGIRYGRRRGGGGESRPLSDCTTGECATVVGNTGARSMEMGFYPGAAVNVINNDPSAACMVVMAGESRFVIPREIAATVAVCRCGGGGGWWRRRARRREGGDAQADS